MKKSVYIYNFSEQREKAIKLALMPLGIAGIRVEKESYKKPLGVLCKIKGFDAPDKDFADFDDEMLLLCGCGSSDIDGIIRALKKCGIGRVDLKAILTDTNIFWSSSELYEAVKADHEEMANNRS